MLKQALMFSGGRDSLVLMHLLREQLDQTWVVWVDTGAATEFVQEFMEDVKATVPHFFHATSNQPGNIQEYGYPTDILPVWYGVEGRFSSRLGSPKLQTPMQCCGANIWLPMYSAIRDLEVSTVYFGQRGDDDLIDPRWDRVVDGVAYKYPLKDWNQKMVQEYLIHHKIPIPAYYEQGELDSRDCWSCTAYLNKKKNFIRNLPPEQREVVLNRLKTIADTISGEWQHLIGVFNDND